ncbi:MAG: sodium-dependent transporter [Bacteroidales bacterium]|nr:sodium-dependent transporter [Bacteroidales bacterium]
MRRSEDGFSSRIGVMLAVAGSAVGLGNLWRFPYLVGENGGAAFIIIYIFFVLILCLPILFSEFVVGRRAQSNAVRAFKVLRPGTKFTIVGLFAVLSATAVLSFYSVVGGWTVSYLVKSLTFKLIPASSGGMAETFNNLVTNPYAPLFYHFIFLLLTSLVVILGVKKGIEKYSKIMMPILFIMVTILAVRNLFLDGASEGLSYLFKPDFSAVTASTVMAALGQSFFSLSIGCGTILTYASYVKKEENLIKVATSSALVDTLFALIAGCAIMPAVFSFGVSPSEGPGLAFIILPEIFGQMPMGELLALIFFIILFFAAITSSVSLLEVPVAYLIEEFKIKRSTAVTIAFGVLFVLGGFASLSQGPLSDVKIFGLSIFDLFDYISSNVLMLFGGLLMVIFVGWVLGKREVLDELTNGASLKWPKWLLNIIFFIIKYFAPLVIISIMISNWL